ncbi:hypothetical protein CR513_03398, partial [Mucuna pruriens]
MFQHIHCEENQMVDALETLSSIEIEEEINRKPWYYDIMHYIKDKEYPHGITENNKRTLRKLAMGFFLNRDVLYKRNSDMTLLRYVDAREAKEILKKSMKEPSGLMQTNMPWQRKS